MTAGFVEIERIESRIIGAIRCIDAVTGAPIDEVLQLDAPGARFVRNRSGLYVIQDAAELASYTASFEPPYAPATGSLSLNVAIEVPSGRYLSRIVSVALPRDPDPMARSSTGSLFRPIDVPLYPAAAADVAANWAVLRVCVSESGGDKLGGALLRVLRNGEVLARGLSDWRGEALVPVAGVPVTTFGEDTAVVVTSEIEVTLEALFDPAAGTRVPEADVRCGRPPFTLPRVDPAAIDAAAASHPKSQQTLFIAARRSQSASIAIALP